MTDWKRPQPAPSYLRSRLRTNFPEIKKMGIYNDRNIAGTTKKSAHAEGRAIDIHLNAAIPSQRTLGDQLVSVLIRKAPLLGIDNVIWNRQIWSRTKGGPRTYKGKSPHTDHIHVEFTRAGSQQSILRAIEIDIAIIRSGLEDLKKSYDSVG